VKRLILILLAVVLAAALTAGNIAVLGRIDRWYGTFEIQDPSTYYTQGRMLPVIWRYVLSHFLLFALLYAGAGLLARRIKGRLRTVLVLAMNAVFIAAFFLTLEYPFAHLSARHIKSLRFHPRLTCALTPGYSRKEDIAINSLGFRGDEITREKPPGVFRIAVLGDSALFGAGERQAETAPQRLQALLDQRLPGGYQVINAAVPGYSTADGVYVLEHRALPLKPDVVIAGFNNDADSSWMEDKIRFRRDLVRDAITILADRSAFFRIASEAHMTEIPPSPPNVSPSAKVRRVSIEDHGRNMEAMARLCRHAGAVLIILGMPEFVESGNSHGWVKVSPEYRAVERSTAAACGAYYLDFKALWGSGDKFFFYPDMYHLNPKGCAALAKDILAFLEKEHLLSPPKPGPLSLKAARRKGNPVWKAVPS
jgi:lysophospholipase L1-like esterase